MKRVIKSFVVLTLLGALVYGWTCNEDKTLEQLVAHFQSYLVERLGSISEGYRLTADKAPLSYVYPGRATGWGGPMTVAPVVSEMGSITGVVIPEHRETPAFIDYLLSQNFLSQFNGKSPTDPIELGQDIDAVSGATVSSRAITLAVRQGMNIASAELLGKVVPEKPQKWKYGRDETLLTLLYAAVIFCIFFKVRKARLVVLVLSFLFLGLMMKHPVSISNIATLFMGHAPDIRQNVFWWLLVPGSMGLVVLLGRNVYCSWLCPFGAILEVIARTGGLRMTIPKKIQSWLKTAAKFFAWLLLMIAFATSNASYSSVEPFSTLFGLKGATFQWYLVSLAIGGSFLIPRFWCRFFCPAGVCFNSIVGIRQSVKGRISAQTHIKDVNIDRLKN